MLYTVASTRASTSDRHARTTTSPRSERRGWTGGRAITSVRANRRRRLARRTGLIGTANSCGHSRARTRRTCGKPARWRGRRQCDERAAHTRSRGTAHPTYVRTVRGPRTQMRAHTCDTLARRMRVARTHARCTGVHVRPRVSVFVHGFLRGYAAAQARPHARTRLCIRTMRAHARVRAVHKLGPSALTSIARHARTYLQHTCTRTHMPVILLLFRSFSFARSFSPPLSRGARGTPGRMGTAFEYCTSVAAMLS